MCYSNDLINDTKEAIKKICGIIYKNEIIVQVNSTIFNFN